MFQPELGQYDLIDGEETPSIKDNDIDAAHAHPSREPHLKLLNLYSILVFIISSMLVLLLGVSIGLLIKTTRHHYPHDPNHVLDDSELDIFQGVNFPSQPTRFNGSLFHRSKYAGRPSPELDAAWARWTDTGNEYMPHYPALLRISAHDVQLSSPNGIEAAVRFEDGDGGGYMATLGMYHEIHCLEMLRKFVDFDYYSTYDPGWANAPLLREHTDHCLDMLLSLLLCRASTTLVTYHWREGFSSPVPDFSTRDSCRDPEDALRWTRSNAVHLSREITKPPNAAELAQDF